MSNSAPPGREDPALVVLVGASGAGKSTWAAAHYPSGQIVSSDRLRGVVGTGPADLDASVDAFLVLDQVIRARSRRKLTTVVDTLGLDPARRTEYLGLARSAGMAAVVVVFDAPARLCRSRNAGRDRPVPAPALAAQLRKVRELVPIIAAEGWDDVLTVAPDPDQAPVVDVAQSSARMPEAGGGAGRELEFILQLSRFPWGAQPAQWLAEVAVAARDAGFAGLALMDHLIQIPQVGRAWDPIPEPWVTLGLLAGLDLGLRLGTLVSPVSYRLPGLVAKAAATLDVLSGGRAFCGLGAGWWEREHRAFGLPFPSAARRLDLLEPAIETMRALWSPGTKALDGEHAQLPETTCYPRPVGTLPIIVGGGGERRTLLIAARSADGCNLPSDPEVLAHKLSVLRRHCEVVGRDPAQLWTTVLDVPILGAEQDEVAAAVERLRGRSSAAVLQRRAGLPADHVTRYRHLARLGVQTVFLSPAELAGPADVARFAPVVQAF